MSPWGVTQDPLCLRFLNPQRPTAVGCIHPPSVPNTHSGARGQHLHLHAPLLLQENAGALTLHGINKDYKQSCLFRASFSSKEFSGPVYKQTNKLTNPPLTFRIHLILELLIREVTVPPHLMGGCEDWMQPVHT